MKELIHIIYKQYCNKNKGILTKKKKKQLKRQWIIVACR